MDGSNKFQTVVLELADGREIAMATLPFCTETDVIRVKRIRIGPVQELPEDSYWAIPEDNDGDIDGD